MGKEEGRKVVQRDDSSPPGGRSVPGTFSSVQSLSLTYVIFTVLSMTQRQGFPNFELWTSHQIQVLGHTPEPMGQNLLELGWASSFFLFKNIYIRLLMKKIKIFYLNF